jgi:hypothetical protein
MGILEDSLITLENGDKIDVKELKLDDNIVLTCQIDGLNPKSVNKEAIGWSKINPIIEKKMARVSKKWKENIDKYIVVNNKLKLSLDTIILFKDFEGETTWGYSKSLRKGYFLFTDRFEYEEIKSIKRVKENVDTICLSVHSFSYYFANGYLVHNTTLCGQCGTCWLWPACLQPYGPHSYSGRYYNSTSYDHIDPLDTGYGHNLSQVNLYGPPGGTTSATLTLNSYNAPSFAQPSTNRTAAWNYFPQTMNLKNSVQSGGGAYFVVKYWDRGATPETNSTVTKGVSGIGWKAYYGNTTSNMASALTEAQNVAKGQYGCPWDLFWFDQDGGDHRSSGGRNGFGTACYNSTSGNNFKIKRHSANGVTFYISRDKGTSWTPYNEMQGPSDIREGSSYDGERGDSKILVVIKVICPSAGSTELQWRWELGSTARIVPHGWMRFVSYA